MLVLERKRVGIRRKGSGVYRKLGLRLLFGCRTLCVVEEKGRRDREVIERCYRGGVNWLKLSFA